MIGIHEFLPHSDFMELVGMLACQDGSNFQDVCSNILFLIAGYDSKELNQTLLPVYTTNTPAGAATKQFVHYGQEVNSAQFRRFDYGWIENLIQYGSTSPPNYDLSKVTAPVALFYSDNDALAGVEVN